jgi:hypothetical protein
MLRYVALVALATPPQYAIQTPTSPVAPQAIAVISCQVDDLGLDALPDNVIPTHQWKNLEWRRDKSGNLICKREIVPIQDKDEVVNNQVPLKHNFGDPGQCAHGSALFFTNAEWDKHHPNYAVIAVGCPTPIVNDEGKIVSWHMPECPSHVPGNPDMPIRCDLSENEI